jgi:4-hydroxy-tetrahydrodipicolinate reductase
MLRIGLLGYGKMGKAIEAITQPDREQIVWRIGRDNAHTLTQGLLQTADVVIEFSRPEAAWSHVKACLDAGVPVVCGTTGWNQDLPAAEKYCLEKQGAFLWASNFSIGVNLFFALNRYLSKLMDNQPQYHPVLTEIHHIHKLDAPSGTAITLAQGLVQQATRMLDFQLSTPENNLPEATLPIVAIREGEVPGTHRVQWQSNVDDITIEHRAHSRQGFAWGALTAARWLANKKGVYTMSDVLQITDL